jgi:hypothetical protein
MHWRWYSLPHTIGFASRRIDLLRDCIMIDKGWVRSLLLMLVIVILANAVVWQEENGFTLWLFPLYLLSSFLISIRESIK